MRGKRCVGRSLPECRASGNPQCRQPRSRPHQQGIPMAMIAPIELDDLLPSREPSRQPYGAHGCLGSGIDHAHHFHGWDHFHHLLGHLDFQPGGNPVGGSILRRSLNGSDDGRMSMAKDQRPPGADIVNVLIPVFIPNPRSLSFSNENRVSSDGSGRPNRAVDPAGDPFLSFLVQCPRTIPSHGLTLSELGPCGSSKIPYGHGNTFLHLVARGLSERQGEPQK